MTPIINDLSPLHNWRGWLRAAVAVIAVAASQFLEAVL